MEPELIITLFAGYGILEFFIRVLSKILSHVDFWYDRRLEHMKETSPKDKTWDLKDMR